MIRLSDCGMLDADVLRSGDAQLILAILVVLFLDFCFWGWAIAKRLDADIQGKF